MHEALARTSQPTSYAVELDAERARRCRQHFPATTINASWEDVVSSNKAVSLFGVKRDRPQNGNNDIAAMIVAAGMTRPPAIDQAPVVPYPVPDAAIDAKKHTLRNKVTSRDDLLTLYAQHGAQTTDAYKGNDHPDKTIQFQPVIQLKTGHVAAMIRSGATPVMNLGELILRSTSTKVETVKDADGNILKKGGADPNAAKVSEAFVSDLYILKPDGTYQILNNNPKAFQELLNQHGAALHADITRRYQPLYGEPTPAEWAATGKYMHGKRLPGMKRTGPPAVRRPASCGTSNRGQARRPRQGLHRLRLQYRRRGPPTRRRGHHKHLRQAHRRRGCGR